LLAKVLIALVIIIIIIRTVRTNSLLDLIFIFCFLTLEIYTTEGIKNTNNEYQLTTAADQPMTVMQLEYKDKIAVKDMMNYPADCRCIFQQCIVLVVIFAFCKCQSSAYSFIIL